MKIILKSLSGKSLVVDVSPTDTFVELQERTLKKTGCLLNLEHFKYKGQEVKAENNVMKYFQSVTKQMNTSGVKNEEPTADTAGDFKDPVVAKDSLKLSSNDSRNVSNKSLAVKFGREPAKVREVSKQARNLITPKIKRCFNPAKTKANLLTKVHVQEALNSQDSNLKLEHQNEILDSKSNISETGNRPLVKDANISENLFKEKTLKCKLKDSLDVGNEEKVRETSQKLALDSCNRNKVKEEQNYVKGSARENSKTKNSVESKIPVMDTALHPDNEDSINETGKLLQLQTDISVDSENSLKSTMPFTQEMCSKDETITNLSQSKLKPDGLNIENEEHKLYSASIRDSVNSCPKSDEEESCLKDSYIFSNATRTSAEVNLTTPKLLKMLESTNMDTSMLSKATVNPVDVVTVTNIKSETSTNDDMCCAEQQLNMTGSSTLEMSDFDVDSEHPGQLCRLCALPRENLVYIFSEMGLRHGLRSKINTWLPTHVSRTDPLPKQVCDICIKKLNFCQSFGTACMKAEQTLNKMFHNRKFRCHIQTHEEAAESPIKNSTDSENLESKVTDVKPNKLLSDSDEQTNYVSKSVAKSDIFSSSSSFVKGDFKKDSIKSEPLSSEDEGSNLISEDSSEDELVDMILGDDCDQRDNITEPTNYCCPLCCEGNMVTLKQTIKDTVLPSSKLNIVPDIQNNNQVTLKNNLDSSADSELGSFKYKNIECMNGDYDSYDDDHVGRDSDSDIDGNSDSNSFILNYSNVKMEEDNSQEDLTGRIDGGNYIMENNVNTKQENIAVKSERTEDDSPVNCVVCGEAEINLNQCLVHALRDHGDRETQTYPCSLCEMCFSVDTDLTRHFMNIHQNIKVARLLHICIVCGRRCASQRALKSHVCIPINSVTDQLACKTCGLSFSTKARLIFHRQFHDPEARPLECVPCGMVFAEEDNLFDHIRFSHRGKAFICNECGGHFNSKAALCGHLRYHRNLRHHKCEVCNKTFLDKQTLKEHSVCHMEVKPFQCHICGKYLNRNSRLKKHLMSHELQKTTNPQECFQCTVCGETFPNEPKAVAHAQVGHALPSESECVFQLFPIEKVYRCEFCERCYADPAYLNTHRSTHIDESVPYKCHICGAGFATFARVATHKVTHGVYEKKDEFTIPKLYLCDTCDKAYVHWTYLSVHRKMTHAEVKHMYKCKMCPEQFVNSWSLAYHRKTRHCETAPPPLDSDMPANERKRWKCEYCDKRYVSQQSLLAHIGILHTGDNPGPSFQCDQCGKRFARKLSLDSHKKTHTGSKPHVCPLCKKTFVHSSGLSSHLRLHRGDKPHSCQYCGKTFLQRGDRDDHVRKHTGERPFSCQHCPKSFRTRAMWFEHTRIHRDERPFPCDICGAAFRRSYALKNHKTIHTGERPHVCNICGKAFRQKQDMQKHLKNHHQELQENEASGGVMTIVLPTDECNLEMN